MDFLTKYNEHKEKWERINEIKKQISLCVSMNMSVPKLIKRYEYNLYKGTVVYMGKRFYYGIRTLRSQELNMSFIQREIVYYILKWECKERGIEYPPRLEG